MNEEAELDCNKESISLEQSSGEEKSKKNVKYILRDKNNSLVKEWRTAFADYQEKGADNFVHISCGDIFDGAPSCDALVSPANSFGFMDGGIDMVYSKYFGWQMQSRLQEVIRKEHDGEILVGDATIIPAYETEPKTEDIHPSYNEGQPIKYLISAPTMRVPECVEDTVNAYLAFRAVILAVNKHNQRNDVDAITTVMCPGLGTYVGEMPNYRCAFQMLKAFELFHVGLNKKSLNPDRLWQCTTDHLTMKTFEHQGSVSQKIVS